jgi:hypothetical protein
VKVQVTVIRLASQLANRFQLAQVKLQEYLHATAAAVQSARVKVQVIARRSAIQDRIAPV